MEIISPANSAKCSKKIAFSSAEKELIISLVSERPIIENKQTNARNIELKRAAWDEIENAYNAVPFVVKRTALQLKRCWENIKSCRKKELSMEVGSLLQTGGGVGEAGTTENVIDSICPYINLTVPGVIDSNTEEKVLVKLSSVEIHAPEKIDKENQHDNEVIESLKLSKRKRGLFPLKTLTDNNGKLSSEVQVRVKRCKENIEQDSELHKLRVQREKILIKKEEILLEKESQQATFQIEKNNLEIKKLKLEIALLEKKLN
ncbi:unnamed protein product [Parnassius mnemosyne]|uniref:Regulatory protein zeste n=2 Tax=Parnassius mnemosyne TaxID=213953 RepID=A0AAV1LRV6_9NEOP